MRKKYTRFPLDQPHPAFKNERAVWLPVLSVRVGRGHAQTPRIPAVVDSGSPYCMFHASVADYLGIDLAKGIEHFVGGIISDPKEPIYFHKVKIYVELDWVIEVMAGFVKKTRGYGHIGAGWFL